MKSINKKTKMIIAILILIECFSIFLTFKSFSNKDIIKETHENILDKNTFAIMLENDNGEYAESTLGLWPGEGYKFNSEKSTCVDNNGNNLEGILSFDSVTNTAYVSTKKTTFCYLYFDKDLDGIIINVNTDGTRGEVPSATGYNKSIICGDGSNPIWNYKYNRLEFGNVKSDSTICDLTYTKRTIKYSTLIETIQNLKEKTDINNGICTNEKYTTQEACEAAKETWWGVFNQTIKVAKEDATWTTLSQNEYNILQNNSASSFTFSSNKWTQTADERYTTSSIKLSPTSDGYYRICYELPPTSSNNSDSKYKNYIWLHVPNDTEVFEDNYSIYNVLGSLLVDRYTVKDCFDYGYLKANDYIEITGHYYNKNISFYMQKTNDFNIIETGYRYTGMNPSNYVWFNNEYWRIVGYVPTKDANSKSTQLVKLVRLSPMYEHEYPMEWSESYSYYESKYLSSDLFDILNNYYYFKSDASDSYCMDSRNRVKCDYRYNGIDSDYRNMIVPTQWSFGYSGTLEKNYINYTTIRYSYINEENNYTSFTGGIKVGLLNNSDKFLAELPNSDSSSSYKYYVYDNESWINPKVGNSNLPWVFPVVYLNNDLVVLDGTGSFQNPYILIN